MKISTKGKHAVAALLYMAANTEVDRWSIKTIAAEIGVAQRYLEQIFFALRKAEILDTVRGIKGGYFLSKDPKELTVGDIIRATEGEIIPVPCVTCKEKCASNIQDVCSTRDLWCKLLDSIHEVIDHVFLTDLVQAYISRREMENESINKG